MCVVVATFHNKRQKEEKMADDNTEHPIDWCVICGVDFDHWAGSIQMFQSPLNPMGPFVCHSCFAEEWNILHEQLDQGLPPVPAVTWP
jgi:hypothetical protein